MISIISKILSLLTKKERRKATSLLLMMIVGMLLETISVSLVIPFIGLLLQDGLVDKYPIAKTLLEHFNYTSQTVIITGAMTFLVSVYFFKNIFLAFSIWKQTSFAYYLQQRISEQLFKLYLTQPYTFHLQRNSAELIRNITTEVSLFTFAINAILLLITELLVVIGIASVLIYIEPSGAIVVMSTLLIAVVLFTHITKNRILNWGTTRQHHDGLRIQHLQQGLGGIKEVKLYGREADFLCQFSIHNNESARTSSHQIMLQQFPRLWLEFLAIFGLSLLVFIMIIKGSSITTIIPTLGLFAAAAFRLMPSANRFLGALQTLRFNIPVVSTLHKELIATFSEPHFPNKETKKLTFEIQLDNISYSYTNTSEKAINDISLSIKKGEVIGLIGASGSGKSTLVDILLGLLTPTKGKLLIDGKDISSNLRGWQNQIGYVPQSIYLTDDTLKSNIAFGLAIDKIDEKAVADAIKASQLESFVNDLPDGIETVVGERGVRLSGGQRQRIGIARALYHNPEILILDEATSALDTETEHYVMQAIYALQRTKTIVIVAHRLSTVEKCDKLFQLESGEIISSGLPKDLLKKTKMHST
jgi:ATP-binding cassette, subfamily B, bacterial PglK